MKEIGHKSSLFPQDYFYVMKEFGHLSFSPMGPPTPATTTTFFLGGGGGWTITTFMTKFLHKSSLFPQDYFYEGNWS